MSEPNSNPRIPFVEFRPPLSPTATGEKWAWPGVWGMPVGELLLIFLRTSMPVMDNRLLDLTAGRLGLGGARLLIVPISGFDLATTLAFWPRYAETTVPV